MSVAPAVANKTLTRCLADPQGKVIERTPTSSDRVDRESIGAALLEGEGALEQGLLRGRARCAKGGLIF